MKLAQAASAAARLAVVSEKSQAALSKALSSWFTAQFIKSAKLQQLRAVHKAGAYSAFAELLTDSPDTDRITLLKKADPHDKDILVRSKAEMLSHIEGLASGRIGPTPKPAANNRSGKKTPRAKKPVGIIATSKY